MGRRISFLGVPMFFVAQAMALRAPRAASWGTFIKLDRVA